MRSKKKLSVPQKERILRLLMDKYESDPAAVEALLPEISGLMVATLHRGRVRVRNAASPLTPKERQERYQSYTQLTKKLGDTKGRLSREEAIYALEDAAALLEGPFDESLELDRNIIKKLISIATGLSLSTKGKMRESVLRDGEPARTVTILRGVKLNLSWDKKLLSVQVDPRQIALREKALAFVGIGHDTATDVASRHDEYFVEAILEK